MLSQEKVTQARQFAAEGIENQMIAKILSISEDTIALYVKDVRKSRKQALTDAVKILADSELYLTHLAIAKLLGISRPSISRIASALNLPNSLNRIIQKNTDQEIIRLQEKELAIKRQKAIEQALELLRANNILARCKNLVHRKTPKPKRNWQEITQELAWKDREIDAEKDKVAHVELCLASERQENEENKETIAKISSEKEILTEQVATLVIEKQSLSDRIRELEKSLAQSEQANKTLSKELAHTQKELNDTQQELAHTKKKLNDTQQELATIREQKIEIRHTNFLPSWSLEKPKLWESLQLLIQKFSQTGLARKLKELGFKVSRALVRTWLGQLHPTLFPKGNIESTILQLAYSLTASGVSTSA